MNQPHPVFVGVVKSKSTRLDHQQHVDHGQAEQKGAVGDLRMAEGKTEKGRGGTDGPVGGAVEAFTPGQTAGRLGPVVMGQGGDGLGAGQFLAIGRAVGHEYLLARLKQTGCFLGVVGDNQVGAGPFHAGEQFEHHPVMVDPALFCGGLEHGIFAGDVVGR